MPRLQGLFGAAALALLTVACTGMPQSAPPPPAPILVPPPPPPRDPRPPRESDMGQPPRETGQPPRETGEPPRDEGMTPMPPETKPGRETGSCSASKVQAAVGKPASPDVLQNATLESGAQSARVLGPGVAGTMEFNPDRLTVTTDAGNRIVNLSCN